MCQLVEINRGSFYAWAAAADARAARQAADEQLAERLRAVHAAEPSNRAYGAPRLTAELNDGAPDGERVNHKRVARVMADHGIAGIRLRRRGPNTGPEPAHEHVPDLRGRGFTPAPPHNTHLGGPTP